MEFLVFRRADAALVVVPALFRPPPACLRHGELRFAGVCDIDLHDFVSHVAHALTHDGYACVRSPDWDLLAQATCFATEASDG